MMTDNDAIRDVIAERLRQIHDEGWTTAHDDHHAPGRLSLAGGCYAFHASIYLMDGEFNREVPTPWPWGKEWWKPTTPRRDLVKAAALLIAEIDRIDRSAANAVQAD